MVQSPGETQGGALLETPRLVLRPFLLEDLDVLHAFFIHPDVRRFLWDDRIVRQDQVRELIAASVDSFARLGFGQWVAQDRRTRALVGFCGLRAIEEMPEIEILYGLVRERWGEGLATEAAKTVLNHAFRNVGLARVVGRTDPPNQASVRVLKRLGMQFEGEHPVLGLPTLHYAISEAAFRGQYAPHA